MVSRLEMVLKELNENGNFRASLFSTSTGLVLASQKDEDVDERVVAAMGSLLSDAAIKAGEEMNLSEAQVMKIFYREDYIICRNIEMKDGKTQFLLAVLAKAPESDEVEKLKEDILAFLSSDLGIALSQIKEERIFKEIPFMLQLKENDPPFVVVLQGVIDLLFRDYEGVWTVVDYKYSAGRGSDRERYKIQLMAYALSVAKRMKGDKIRAVLKIIGEREIPPKEWTFMEIELKDFEKQINTHIHEIARRQMGDTPQIWARREGEDCRRLDCIYRKRCNT